MTNYCTWGTTEPFKTLNDFFKAVRNQAFGKTEDFFYNNKYPLSYFYFTWLNGYLVLNFYNTKTNLDKRIYLQTKTLSYSLFTKLLDGDIRQYLPALYEYPQPPQKEKTTFLQVLWLIIKWIFVATFWLLKGILKVLWFIITLPFGR